MNPLLVGAGISAAGSLISSLVNRNSVESANAKNEALQREQWARDDTQYQRTVADMRAAGLNPLSGVSPQSSPLSVQNQASQMENPLQELPAILQAQSQMNLQEKMLALNAIKSGVNPKKLEQFSDDKLLNAYRDSIIYGSQETKKNANASGNRYSGFLGKVFGDVRDNADDNANEVIDDVISGVGQGVKNFSGNVKNGFKDLKKAVKSFHNKVENASKRLQENKAKKAANNYLKQHGYGR